MQPDSEEENSLDDADQERRAEIAPGYDIVLGADQYWIRIRKKFLFSNPKENHQLDFLIDYLEKLKPSFFYPYLPLKMIDGSET